MADLLQRMTARTRLNCAGATDPGRVRENNEDRMYYDADRGILLVVDGIGGQAAGEKAAEVAVSMVRSRLERQTGTIEERIREAIAVANNEILRLGRTKEEWRGMACVLTLAVVEDGAVTVGHVGDSRLYKIRRGQIQKLTHDHSPIGEREDAGELSEPEAMRHPRRNEVFRDVGSEEHAPDDPGFIEVLHTGFEPDAALLLCSDGLSDLVPSRRIREIVERHAGDPQRAAEGLIQAANDAGGKDNVTVVLAEGERFAPAPQTPEAGDGTPGLFTGRWAFFAYGLLVAAAAGLAAWRWLAPAPAPPPRSGPALLVVGSAPDAGFRTIAQAIAQAKPGDVIRLLPGSYNEEVRLTHGVILESRDARQAVLAVPVLVDAVRGARIAGLRIPGVRIVNSTVELEDNEIAGTGTGVEIEGTSSVVLRANLIDGNAGPGVVVRGNSYARLAHNVIAGNGKVRGALRPGVEIVPPARADLAGNTFADNGAQDISKAPEPGDDAMLKNNWFIPRRRPGGRR